MKATIEMKHGRSGTARIAGAGLYVMCEGKTVPEGYVQLHPRGSNGMVWSARPVPRYSEAVREANRVRKEG